MFVVADYDTSILSFWLPLSFCHIGSDLSWQKVLSIALQTEFLL